MTETDEEAPLVAPHRLSYDYTRSTGPVVGAYLTGLRDGRLQGIRGADGRVLVPPQEYDPITAAELSEFVELGTAGTVVSWSWNPVPRPGQPLDRPFAWALVRPDGADTPLLAALSVTAPEQVRTGMRVQARFADERLGRVTDLAYFEPADAA